MEKVRIALLGLGNVGKGVWNILKSNKEAIMKRAGYDIEVAKILVRDKNKNRGVDVPYELLTTNADEIFNDDSIKIVVEVMGGIEPAKDYILNCIGHKKHIVTANKMLIATNGEEIFKKAREQGVIVNFEASVAGGIPVIHSINESLTANKIQQVIGIINGTTNYILTKMTLEGMSFNKALKEAQEKGYAEADPTSDIEGYDAVYKIAILAKLAFETETDVKDIYVEGITKLKSKDIEYARELGYVIKLLAIAKEVNERLEVRVHPAMVPLIHPLANVNDSFNAVFIRGNAVGDLMLYGRGAGELPTGSAVVGDIISVLRNEGVNFIHKKYDKRELVQAANFKSRYYIRIKAKDQPGVLGEVARIFGESGVSILSFIQKPKNVSFVSIILVTHDTIEVSINKSLEKISELEAIDKIKSVIRIENLV